MNERRQEIARLCFRGASYDEHALDAVALEELVQFQKIVTEMAKPSGGKNIQIVNDCPRTLSSVRSLSFAGLRTGVPSSLSKGCKELKSTHPVGPLGRGDEITEAIDLAYGRSWQPIVTNCYQKVFQRKYCLALRHSERNCLMAPRYNLHHPVGK